MSRLTSSWVTGGTSADAEMHGQLQDVAQPRTSAWCGTLTMRGKQSAPSMNNVIGTGIKLQAQVLMQRGGRLDED